MNYLKDINVSKLSLERDEANYTEKTGYEELRKKIGEDPSLVDLIAKYSEEQNTKTPNKLKLNILKALIVDELRLCTKSDIEFYDEWYIHEDLIRQINLLKAEVDELRKHRHKTIGGLYTEKPAW